MEVVVPFDPAEPCTRLASVLAADERRAFAERMARDVVGAIREAGHSPHVLSTEPTATDWPETADDRSLTAAVNARLAAHDPSPARPLAVVMADLPLVTANTIDRLVAAGRGTASVTVAPGLGGGTNALVVRHPEFRVDYHGASCQDHDRAARTIGAAVHTVDSRRLATDVDEPGDLAEVLLHAEGTAREWLVDRGFELQTGAGRVTAARPE